MDMDYVLMTDSDSDLQYTWADEMNIPVVQMPYVLDGREYLDDNGRSGGEKHFFQRMREGAVPVTSQLPKDAYVEAFEPILKEKNLFFIAFSSKMSSTIQNVYAAREELLRKYPGRQMTVCDTLLISAPMALLVRDAWRQYRQGASMDELRQWVLENRMCYHGYFTVDDLVYLRRGGRISSTSAILGSVLNIKPILVVGAGGLIDPLEKVQGTKKALHTLVARTAEKIRNPEEQEVIIMHADSEQNALELKNMLIARVPGIRKVTLQMVGPVIGAHCGPGTLAICFRGAPKA